MGHSPPSWVQGDEGRSTQTSRNVSQDGATFAIQLCHFNHSSGRVCPVQISPEPIHCEVFRGC